MLARRMRRRYRRPTEGKRERERKKKSSDMSLSVPLEFEYYDQAFVIIFDFMRIENRMMMMKMQVKSTR